MHRFWVVIAIAACGNPTSEVTVDAQMPDAAIAPVFRNPVSLPDDELAKQSLDLLKECSGGVNACRFARLQCAWGASLVK